MSREMDNQQEFLNNLDRILAGEKIPPPAGMDTDVSAALDFARKMAALRLSPSAEFSAQLKARLLGKLTGQEEAARTANKQGWFARLTEHRLVWQALTAVVVIAVIGGLLWGTNFLRFPGGQPSTTSIVSATNTTTTTGVVTTPTGRTTTATATVTTTTSPGSSPLLAKASTDKQNYQPGESVKINVSLTNVSSGNVVIPDFPPILSLMQVDTKQPVYTFTPGTADTTIPPTKTASFTLTWNQQDAKGNPAAPGSYYLELEDINYGGKNIKLIFSTPVTFNILPATATIGVERTFTENQYQIDNNITFKIFVPFRSVTPQK
jgi:hypothetical protein